jgi:hypothetical protein
MPSPQTNLLTCVFLADRIKLPAFENLTINTLPKGDGFLQILLLPVIESLKKIITFALQTYRGMEQLVARRAHNPKVAGSSPAPATKQALQIL